MDSWKHKRNNILRDMIAMGNNKFRKNKTITKRITILSVCILMLCTMTSCTKTVSAYNTDFTLEVESITSSESSFDEIPMQEAPPAETEDDPDQPEKTPDTETATENAEESISVNTLDLDGWALAYYEYINTMTNNRPEIAEYFTYHILYVDDDDIPELLIDTNYTYTFLTWHDGTLDDFSETCITYNYLEKDNLLFCSGGRMGYYLDMISTIQDGKWIHITVGTWNETYDDSGHILLDEKGNVIYEYIWNGESVSEAEYTDRVNTAYHPFEQAAKSGREYLWDDILSIWETGDVASAGHRYELIIEDLSCTEAESACKAKGGYLATLTSFEEWNRVTAQITSEGKENITFWVGTKYHNWLDPEIEGDYDIFDGYDIFFPFWAEGEPSYRGLWENDIEMEEDCTVLFYNTSDDRYYLNDVPDNLLYAAPFYTGKIGYICEYDE